MQPVEKAHTRCCKLQYHCSHTFSGNLMAFYFFVVARGHLAHGGPGSLNRLNSARITGGMGMGDFPPLRLSVPHCSCSWHPRGDSFFVPGTAGARVSLTNSSTSASHVTHLIPINLSASIFIIALVLLLNVTFTNSR